MGSQIRWTGIAAGVFLGLLLSAVAVLAGSLEPSVGPTAPGSQMYTLEQVYNRIKNGTAATKMTTFAEPSSGPMDGTMPTLDKIYELVGLRAPVAKTGQNQWTPLFLPPFGSDGDLHKGVVWPAPRFTDNGIGNGDFFISNGTVTDNLTGLIWLKNANCFGAKTWSQALSEVTSLATGSCGLSDGSTVGQWRLPNVREMQSLIHYGFSNPALSNTQGTEKWTEGAPFIGILSDYYWLSTTFANAPNEAWYVILGSGIMSAGTKGLTLNVWAVRGGH